MKITKLLAMLLALAMILCCFAACGSSDDEDKDEDEKVEEKDDDKDEDEDDKSKDDDEDDKSKDEDDKSEDDEEDKNSDEDEETEAIVDAKDEELEGRWKTELDLGPFLVGSDEDADLPELMFGIEFEFKDGSYTSSAVDIPDVDVFADFILEVDPSIDREDAVLSAESLIEEIEDDPRMIYGDFELKGNVIVLDELTEVTFDIDGDEMTFEKIVSDSTYYTEYMIFEGVTFEKQ